MPALGPGGPPSDELPLESTASLLRRAASGDATAKNTLFERYYEALRRWAHGRVPHSFGLETGDFVQEALMRALPRMDSFEPRREGAFLAYLREILKNQILDAERRRKRRPPLDSLPDQQADDERSPLEIAIGREFMETYERALQQLDPETREAVILRIEFGFKYRQIAEALQDEAGTTVDDKEENRVRMQVTRALVKLAEWMGDEG